MSFIRRVADAASDVLDANPGKRERIWLGDRRLADPAAASYSRFVGIAKIVLPVTAALLVLLILGYSAFNKPVSDLTLTFSDLANLGGEKIVTNPTLTYTDEANRSFVVKAKEATQLGKTTENWRLNDIRARMTEAQGNGFDLTSSSGVLDTKAQVLDLAGAIDVRSDDGFVFRATTARVDMDKGRVVSNSAVSGEGPSGAITADAFELFDEGKRVRFKGNVHFRAKPDVAPGEAAP